MIRDPGVQGVQGSKASRGSRGPGSKASRARGAKPQGQGRGPGVGVQSVTGQRHETPGPEIRGSRGRGPKRARGVYDKVYDKVGEGEEEREVRSTKKQNLHQGVKTKEKNACGVRTGLKQKKTHFTPTKTYY